MSPHSSILDDAINIIIANYNLLNKIQHKELKQIVERNKLERIAIEIQRWKFEAECSKNRQSKSPFIEFGC